MFYEEDSFERKTSDTIVNRMKLNLVIVFLCYSHNKNAYFWSEAERHFNISMICFWA